MSADTTSQGAPKTALAPHRIDLRYRRWALYVMIAGITVTAIVGWLNYRKPPPATDHNAIQTRSDASGQNDARIASGGRDDKPGRQASKKEFRAAEQATSALAPTWSRRLIIRIDADMLGGDLWVNDKLSTHNVRSVNLDLDLVAGHHSISIRREDRLCTSEVDVTPSSPQLFPLTCY